MCITPSQNYSFCPDEVNTPLGKEFSNEALKVTMVRIWPNAYVWLLNFRETL